MFNTFFANVNNYNNNNGLCEGVGRSVSELTM